MDHLVVDIPEGVYKQDVFVLWVKPLQELNIVKYIVVDPAYVVGPDADMGYVNADLYLFASL
jgi:hypothetical protein